MEFKDLRVGHSVELEFEVTTEYTINRSGKKGAEVLSTPSLLHMMEMTCIEATDHRLPEGFVTVGFAVDGLRHLAPTALGSKVKIRAELTKVDGRKLTYRIEAHEGEDKIGVATHGRAAIPAKM